MSADRIVRRCDLRINQGEHKLARGYRPTTTYSAHYIADPAFRAAIADYLARERREVNRDAALLAEFLPFREGPALEPTEGCGRR